jgi:putative ABC transport system ATP-binding protein
VYENIELPFLYASNSNRQTRQRIFRAIDSVGLMHRVKHKPAELSGGEMQRVAIARALVIEPTLILADEPTGNLDSETSEDILQLFQELHLSGATIVMVTHDLQVAASAETIVMLQDGVVVPIMESTIGKSTKDT